MDAVAGPCGARGFSEIGAAADLCTWAFFSAGFDWAVFDWAAFDWGALESAGLSAAGFAVGSGTGSVACAA